MKILTNYIKQYNLVPAKGGDLFGWESNRGPGGKLWQPTTGLVHD